jgi:hypothetical protein
MSRSHIAAEARSSTMCPTTMEITISAPEATTPATKRRQQQSVARTVGAMEHLIEAFPPHELDEITELIERTLEAPDPAPEEAALLADVIGEQVPSKQERVEIELYALMRSFRLRRELLANSLTATQVADLLGTSRQTPHDRVRSDTLIAVLDNGALRFPAWQFDSEGPDGVVPGLPEVLKALHISPLNKVSWLVHPNTYLEGLTPLEALRKGRVDLVKELAETIGIV